MYLCIFMYIRQETGEDNYLSVNHQHYFVYEGRYETKSLPPTGKGLLSCSFPTWTVKCEDRWV